MHRFFVDENSIGNETITIVGSDVNHIANVLRMRVGETILISDGKDHEYICEISSISPDEVVATIVDMNKESRELPIKVTLFQGLPKGDKMDAIIEKNIELGISSIVPVRMSRCVVKLDDAKAAKKVTKWNAKAESAAKQSKRGIVPFVENVVSYDEALKMASSYDVILLPYELAENMTQTREVLDNIKPGMSVCMFIGPEGGFGEDEAKKAIDIGAKNITLGRRILRTETAGMMLMSVLMYLNEE